MFTTIDKVLQSNALLKIILSLQAYHMTGLEQIESTEATHGLVTA